MLPQPPVYKFVITSREFVFSKVYVHEWTMDSGKTRTAQLKLKLIGFWSKYIVCLQTRFFRTLIKIDSTMIQGEAGKVESRIDMPVLKFRIQGSVHNLNVVFILVV